MKQIFILLIGAIISINTLSAQELLRGVVTNEKQELLIGATVYWKGTQKEPLPTWKAVFPLNPKKKPPFWWSIMSATRPRR